MSKLINFNKDYKNTSRSVRNAVSQLQLQLATAIKQQCYIRENPDSNLTAEDITAMQVVLTEIITEFELLIPMVDDIKSTYIGGMATQDLIDKYSVDVAAYSAELEDAPVDWS